MRIKNVRVNNKTEAQGANPDGTRLIAFASIVLSDGKDDFVVSHIRIVEQTEGRRMVSMPSRVSSDGTYRDVAYPLTDDLRQEIKHEVLEAVDRA